MSTKKKAKLPEGVIDPGALDNQAKRDLAKERDDRCVPLAFELIKSLASMESLQVGSYVDDDIAEANYSPVIHKMVSLMIEKGVKVTEIVYIFSIAAQAFDYVKGVIDETMNQNINRNTETMYGLGRNDSDEITVKHLNDVTMRRHLLAGVWNPVLQSAVENEHPALDKDGKMQ